MISYAQNAEDVMLARVFGDSSDGVYVDVGAGDPTDCSVTRHFYDLGWSGINVEPDPTLHPRLSLERPRDINLAVALSDHEGTGTMLFAPPSLPGTSTMHAELLGPLPSSEGFQPHEVELTTLAAVLDRHPLGNIDFVKIDVEGHEDAVIRGGDWARHSPRVVVVEATVPHTPVPAQIPWESVLVEAGYRCALFDGLNRFYAKADDTDALEALSVPANVFDQFEPSRWSAPVRALQQDVRTLHKELDRVVEYARDLERHLADSQQRAEESAAGYEQWKDLRRRVCDLAREARRVVGFDARP